jgi:cytochrome c-type biogenesis protein CcmH/NrfG
MSNHSYYAEALMNGGQIELALKNYKRSLELTPDTAANRFGNMTAEVLTSSLGFQSNISVKLNFRASVSATST